MGMPSRKFLLLGFAAVAGLAAIADQTFLSKASASIADLGGMVEEVKKVQAITASLDSGDPNALQGLLDALATDQDVTPGQADSGLFGLASLMPAELSPSDPATAETGEESSILEALTAGPAAEPVPVPASMRRVTMVLKSASGGLAMLDGNPVRTGQTVNGVTLLEVRDDGVTVRENSETVFLALR